MDTTTSGDGVVDGVASDEAVTNTTQPKESEAVKAEDTQVDDAASQKDESQDPDKSADEAVSEETQAPDDTIEWAKKKGLEINPDNPNEIKLAQMQREAEKKMHEATQAKMQPPDEVPLTGNEGIDEVITRQNVADMKLYVRDWFDANPDMKDYRNELSRIAQERPWLQDMDDVKAHFLADPARIELLKKQGGREALTNLAQKQQAVPPQAGATNSGVFESTRITPENVDELVAKNSTEWYNTNRDAIRAAAFGQSRQ